MAKAKELKPIPELYSETVSKYSLEQRVSLHTLIGTGIKNEATALKETGQKAEQILNNLENGQQH